MAYPPIHCRKSWSASFQREVQSRRDHPKYLAQLKRDQEFRDSLCRPLPPLYDRKPLFKGVMPLHTDVFREPPFYPSVRSRWDTMDTRYAIALSCVLIMAIAVIWSAL